MEKEDFIKIIERLQSSKSYLQMGNKYMEGYHDALSEVFKEVIEKSDVEFIAEGY